MLVQFLYGWSILKSQLQSKVCLGDSCTLVISSEDGHRALTPQVLQGADWSLQLFSSHSFLWSLQWELLPWRRWQLWDHGHWALPAALCCPGCVPARSCHAGCCSQGLPLLLLSYFVCTQMLETNTCTFMYFVELCFLFSVSWEEGMDNDTSKNGDGLTIAELCL